MVHAQKRITIADITTDYTFYPQSVYNLNWMNEGKYFANLKDNKIVKFDVETSKYVADIFDGEQYNDGQRISGFAFDQQEKNILIRYNQKSIYRRSYTADYYLFNRATKKLEPLTTKKGISYATISPKGDKVAFVYKNNLYITDLNKNPYQDLQITKDGAVNNIINGSSDWVYEEEFSITKTFSWSKDGNYLAYLKFDESHVKEYNMQVWEEDKEYPKDYRYKYPKAGEKNAIVSLHIYNLNDKQTKKVNTGNNDDIYIPRLFSTHLDHIFSFIKMNRLQNKMELKHLNVKDNTVKTIITEASDTYVDLEFLGNPYYTNDGKYIIQASERSGFKHLYLYSFEGKLIRQITKGAWDVTKVNGFSNDKKPKIYYTSTAVSSKQRHFYQTDITGKRTVKLTNNTGVNRVEMSKDLEYYLLFHSSHEQVPTVSLFKTATNSKLVTIVDNKPLEKKCEEYGLATKSFLDIPGADGTPLNAYFLKPKNFDSSKKYPVMIYQYSGPGSQNVKDSWGERGFHQMLLQRGILVLVVDTRGTGGRGTAFRTMTYKQLGKYEAEDIIVTAKYLEKLPYIEKDRIGLWGWSYGGYMSSLALFTGNGAIDLAIAVAPVTTWRFYDTIYTERYLQRPQENAVGYDENSPIKHATEMTGDFFLIHGTGDDNVHFQNAVMLEKALIEEGKQFRTFYYPNLAHGLGGGKYHAHLYQMMLDFIAEKL